MIQIDNLTLARGANALLENTSLTIHAGEKVALVGANGTGKSSLFALLTGQLHEDKGSCSIPKNWRIHSVAQSTPEGTQSATQFVIEGDTELLAAQAQLRQAEDSHDGHAIAQAHTALADLGAHDVHARAQRLLLGLGFKSAELQQAVNAFSGGWRMRLQLARALIARSDLLLLDEPTNHLDLDAVIWLESWLKNHPATIIIVSHDREFLEATTRITVHLAQHQLTRYNGSYGFFERAHAQHLRTQAAGLRQQENERAHLQQFIDRFRAQATKARQVQSRIKALERMSEIEPLLAEADFSFHFDNPDHLPSPMIKLDEAAMGYGNHTVIHQARLTLMPGERIGILGANGQGKSTLIKTLAGTLAPLSGSVHYAKGLAIGYFAQHALEVLNPKDSALSHMKQLAKKLERRDTEQALRQYLGRFRFSNDKVHQRIAELSGGEKARLLLCQLAWQKPNLLLLDEPTNHLDITTREALAYALQPFEGSVLVVSHDRALLKNVCDQFWWIHDGSLQVFDGSLDDYQALQIKLARTKAEPASSKPVAKSSEPRARQPSLQTLQRKFAALETELNTAQAKQNELQEALIAPKAAADIATLSRELKNHATYLESLEHDWLVLAQAIEDAQRIQ